jgi:hypothetical protein
VFGNIDSLKQARLKELHTFDRLETEKALDLEEKLSKSLISSDLEKITLQEEISWRLNAQSSSIGLLTRTGDSILLSFFLSTAQLLSILQLSEITLFNFMTLYSLNITTGGLDWITLLSTL